MQEPIANYYAILTGEIRRDERLPDGAKLFYGEISSLCNLKGYCWATNAYFMKLSNKKSERTISSWIALLKKYGYIDIRQFHKKGDKATSTQRRIYLKDTIIREGITVPSEQVAEFMEGGQFEPFEILDKLNDEIVDDSQGVANDCHPIPQGVAVAQRQGVAIDCYHNNNIEPNTDKAQDKPKLSFSSEKANSSLSRPLSVNTQQTKSNEIKISSKRGIRIDENFTITPRIENWLKTNHSNLSKSRIADLRDSFIDHWLQSNKPDAVKVDWEAAFRTWVRNDKKWVNEKQEKDGYRGPVAGNGKNADPDYCHFCDGFRNGLRTNPCRFHNAAISTS